MNKALPILALLAGLAGGWAGAGYLTADGADSEIPADLRAQLRASEKDVARLESELRVAHGARSKLEEELKTVREQVESSGAAVEDWRALVAGLEEQKSELEEKLAAVGGERVASAKRAMELVEEMKGKPLAAILNPAKVSKLVSELRSLGEAGTQGLLTLLASENKDERAIAASILGQLDDPAAVDALREAAMGDEDEMVASMAARSLMFMDSKEAIPALRDLAENSKYEGARVNSMYGLLRQGVDGSVAMAKKYLDAESSKHRHELASSMFLLTGNESVYPVVDEYYKEMEPKGSAQIGRLAIMYYGSIDTPEARARLVSIRDNEKYGEDVRTAARDALDQN